MRDHTGTLTKGTAASDHSQPKSTQSVRSGLRDSLRISKKIVFQGIEPKEVSHCPNLFFRQNFGRFGADALQFLHGSIKSHSISYQTSIPALSAGIEKCTYYIY